MKLLASLLFICSTFMAAAQSGTDSVNLLPHKMYTLTKKDGSKYKGILLNQSETEVMMNLSKIGITTLKKADIEKFEIVQEATSSDVYVQPGFFTYGEIGGGQGTHTSFKMGADVIDKRNRLYSLFFCYSSHKDPNRPSDIGRGFFGGYPQQSLFMFGLMFGKALPIKSTVSRFILKGGISGGASLTPENYKYSSSWLGNGYLFDKKQETCYGIVLNPTIELPVFSKSGFSFGLYSNINNISTVVAVEGTMQFGKLRNKTGLELARSRKLKSRSVKRLKG